MDQKFYFKQMLALNKATLENSFEGMLMIQEQTEKALAGTLDQAAAWLPEQSREAVMDWVSKCREGTLELKRSLDQGYARLEAMLATGG